MHTTRRVRAAKDFDAWAYNLTWPRTCGTHGNNASRVLPLCGVVDVVVEDCKFAYNAWSVLRLAAFFGAAHPRVLSGLTRTTPSMDIARGCNRLFYMHSRVDAQLARGQTHIALTPCDDAAVSLHNFDWRALLACKHSPPHVCGDGAAISIVAGMENGMSAAVRAQCTHAVYIPQYGTIGSLSQTCALAIAVHRAWTALHGRDVAHTVRCLGHMPQSRNERSDATTPRAVPGPPHERDLLACTTDELRQVLQQRRTRYALQLAVVVYNALGDRNIGAVLRNANAFNCAALHLVHRRRYNHRGALGTDKLIDIQHHAHDSSDAMTLAALRRALAEYEVWLLYPYYPYLCIHDNNDDGAATYVRPHDARLRAWASTRHALTHDHPLARAHAHLLGHDVYLDDDAQLHAAVARVRARGARGIALVVCEEGSAPHPLLASLARRVVYVLHPSRLAQHVQRGLNGGLASAIALHRLRTAIDALS